MKILVYSSVFYPSIGGIEFLTLSLVREFIREGHEVKVVTEQVQDPDRPLEGIEVIHSSEKWKQLKYFFWADLMYMPNITLKGIWLLAFNPFKKWVVSHNDYHLNLFNDRKTKFKNFLTKLASGNIAVSKSVASFMKAPATVIYNCYNDEVFKLYPDESRDVDFVFVGRLVSYKGCELLIDACSELNADYNLNIIGDGAEMNRLKSKVDSLGLQGKIHFLGYKQGEELARMLNSHKTMILPPIDLEGFGIVALEGLACGCEMIVSDAGGLAEAIGEFGEVFPMSDKEALKSKLLKALEKKEPLVIDEKRTKYLYEHSRQVVAKKYLEYFQMILNGKSPDTDQYIRPLN